MHVCVLLLLSSPLLLMCCVDELPGDYAGFPGCGLLRLHSTYRHDLKIYASDEGRVQMTAAAFAKVSFPSILILSLHPIPLAHGLILCMAHVYTCVSRAYWLWKAS